MMSPDLIAFLKAWHDWATNGAPEGKPFWRWAGLCTNSHLFGGDADAALQTLMRETLGPQADMPFGDGEFARRALTSTQHECPKRLAWVRERLIEAGELVA